MYCSRPGSLVIAAGEVADERGLGQGAAAHAGDDGRGGEPLVLALARVHVEIEAAHELAAVEDLEDRDRRVPAGAVERRNSILKSRAAVSSTPASTCA